MTATVTISRKGADRVRALHQWVYRSDVERADGVEAGEVVRVLDPRGRVMGRAFYSDASKIALRFVAFDDVDTDAAFWRSRIERAAAFRDTVVADADAYRLVHGEGDMLSSLVIDRYGDCFAIQTLSQGTDRLKSVWVDLLEELFRPRAIVERNDAKVRELESLPRVSGVLAGDDPGEFVVEENGVKYTVNLLEGQKTGAFLDQRENRAAAKSYAKGRALDCFTYQGSFALHLAGRCEHVVAVDASADAVERVRRNARLNKATDRVEAVEANVFDLLKDYETSGKRFDTIVLDPPAFAKRRQSLEAALRGYKEINLRALKLLTPGGILVTSTCSYHVSEELFLGTVASAAADAGRPLRLLEKRTQGRDHPILLSVPETYYLKCVIVEAY